MQKIFENIEKYILYIVIAGFAVFVLPGFSSPTIIPKEIFLVGGCVLALVIWMVKSLVKKEVTFSIGKFDLGVISLILAYLVSGFIKASRADAFLFPGVVTFAAASGVAYFLINQQSKKSKDGIVIALFASALFLALSILLTELGLYAKIPQLPTFMKDAAFNPLGGALPSAIYLISTLPILVTLIIKEKDLVKRIFFAVASVIIIFGLVMTISKILPGKAQFPKFPNVQTSWEITVETLKKSPILGIGAGNYLTAFNLYRPIGYNQSDLWSVRFTTANNLYFTLITELGFLGLFAIAILLIAIYRGAKSALKEKSWDYLSLIILFIVFAVVPGTQALIFLPLILMAIFSKSEDKAPLEGKGTISPVLAAIPITAIVIFVAFFMTKAVVAETTFKKSLDALGKNDAKATYDLMVKAVNQNSKVDRYHASLAQVDMAIATSLANKKDLTDTDKKTITQLVQAAISEGKATVTLNPNRSGNWEVLAQIYRSVMSFAQGADQFAIQSYTQAVSLDPINPNVRIALGGVYYALGRFDEAIAIFKTAVIAKPDLANAHYNLAVAYREKKDWDNAISEMNSVLNLVKKDSADYKLAQTTLEDLQKNKLTTVKAGESLTNPQKIEAPVIKPPITLPTEASPPAATTN